MKKTDSFLLALIVLSAFVVRLYKFDNPIADWHSWRQSDTSAVSRNFIKYGFDILHPRFDDLSNVASGRDNPNGYRFVEFPIYNVFQAGLFKIFAPIKSGFSIEQWGRLVTIFSSLVSMIFLYLIVKNHRSQLAGLLAAFFFAFLPYNIYFGRTILADTSMVMAILGGIYFFDRFLVILNEVKSPDPSRSLKLTFLFILSILFTASSFLLKPYALFFTLPIIYLAWRVFGFKLVLKWQLWIFTILTLIPLIFWRLWMQQYPQGIPVTAWLFNAGNIRFKGAFFYWIFADRIGRLILGYWGLPIFILGFLSLGGKKMLDRVQHDNDKWFFLSFIVASLVYLFVIARGNVQHDYYQILIIPSIAIFLGLGGEFLLKTAKEYFSKTISYFLFAICSVFMLFFSWYFVRDFFNINNPSIIVAGEAVDRLTPKTAKILAFYNGDTSLLYQTKRQGWSSLQKSLPEMIEMGADYLILVNPTENDYNLGKTYKMVSAKKEYILFDLHKSK